MTKDAKEARKRVSTVKYLNRANMLAFKDNTSKHAKYVKT